MVPKRWRRVLQRRCIVLRKKLNQDNQHSPEQARSQPRRWKWKLIIVGSLAVIAAAWWCVPKVEDFWYLRRRYEDQSAAARLTRGTNFPASEILAARGFSGGDWTGWGSWAGYEFRISQGRLADFIREFELQRQKPQPMPTDGRMTDWWIKAARRMPSDVQYYRERSMQLWVFPDSGECFLYWSGAP